MIKQIPLTTNRGVLYLGIIEFWIDFTFIYPKLPYLILKIFDKCQKIKFVCEFCLMFLEIYPNKKQYSLMKPD